MSPNVRMRIFYRLAILGTAFLLMVAVGVGANAATTHYISTSGADTNAGTSKTAPWAHLPGMRSCVGNCAAYTPTAGDQFILRGCDVWTSSSLPVLWNWSGASGNPISITVDESWFNTSNCPSGWNRPVFDSGQTHLSVGAYFQIAPNSTTSFGVLDNVEMKNLADDNYVKCYNSCSDWTWSNLYLHAWHVVTDGSCVLVGGGANSPNITFTNSIVDGSDATGANPPGGTCYVSYNTVPKNITNNVFHDVANGIVVGVTADSTYNFSGNLIYNILESNAGSHPNAFETQGGATFLIHDNVVHDNLGETAFLGGSGETDYVWNNVFYNIRGNPPDIETRNGFTTGFWFNNTVVPNSGNLCFLQTGSGSTAQTIENNHCITTGGLTNGSAGFTMRTNLVQTPTQAAGQSYTSSEAYAYSPSNTSGGTVGTGTNLTNSCSGTLGSLCHDSVYACSQRTLNGVVQAVCPSRSAIARSSSGAWDVGAYLYSTASAGGPQAPTSLSAVVQ